MATTSLPQRSLGPAGDHAVVHRRVRLHRGLDLLGEDLLAAGVDGDRVAAVQLDDAVGAQAGPVARHRVAHAVDDRVRAGRLGGVAEVAEREAAALGQPAELGVARRRARGSRSSLQHVVAGADRERAGGGAAAGRHVRQLAAGLRRAEPVDDHQRGQVLQELAPSGWRSAARRPTAARSALDRS